jgi:uncharacterized repeat protein (TIGR01451 family)/MYXO-CTERM domain-containing protein
MRRGQLFILGIALSTFGLVRANADSVAQVQTAKRIAKQTIQLIDPQGGTSTGGGGSNVNYAIGDILTFQIRFTPVENGATRGLGGYITEYVPPNTEVVGARIIGSNGETICPHRGGYGSVGWGPRGSHGFVEEGSMSSLYADIGVFYSTDTRTARIPNDNFITPFNGVQMSCNPTGAGQLDELVGANIGGPWFAHNLWDNTQIEGFGCGSSTITTDGKGNTPFGYGSAVAGPETFYALEATETMPSVVEAAGTVGPWKRIKTPCAEIGAGVPATQEGPFADRVGVPTDLGVELSSDDPLPPGTNAVRFAVGELVVGEEYLAEISLRVLGAPLDPDFCNDPPACTNLGADINCAEVFGGDASARAKDGSSGGKDNTWRYFLPAPACVKLDLQFDLDVDKIQALSGDTLTYTITTKNLDSVTTHTNVAISQDLLVGVGTVSFVSATNGGTEAGGVVTWPATTLAPGDEVTHTVTVTATGAASPILSRATYVSDQLPAPGFSVVSLTNVTPLAVMDLAMEASPSIASAGDTVTYTAILTNNGTGAADFACGDCGITVGLPTDFSVVSGTVSVDGVGVADPSGVAPDYLFTSGLGSIAGSGDSVTLQFDALIDPGAMAGAYHASLETYLDDQGAGREIDDAVAQVAPVYVGVSQSDVPTIDAPLTEGAGVVCGSSAEADATTIRVYVDLLEVGSAAASAGRWCVPVPSLVAGQDVSATAENTAASEIESDLSPPVDVAGGGSGFVPACSDGIDNDNDGLIDSTDPGCVDGSDLDETDVPECSNGIDDDNDGNIDFPDDPSCSSYADSTETGSEACQDGVDNDGDGLTDFPDDPGCDSALDTNEADIPQCANSVDDDNDGVVDYPEDLGCDSAEDDDEGDGVVGTPDAGVPDAGSTPDGGVDPGPRTNTGVPRDPGGVGAPAGGCAVSSSGSGSPTAGLGLLCLFALLFRRRRLRR